METILQARGVSKHYGGVRALHEADVDLVAGRVLGIIGPNGAGKTTLLNCLSGAERATSGTVTMVGMDVSRHPAHARARAGIGRTFQLDRLFESLNVLENVMMGHAAHVDYTSAEAVFGTGRFSRSEARRADQAREALERVGLGGYEDADPAVLSPGIRRLIAIARVYLSDPKVMLLDEPTGGLSSREAAKVFDLVTEFAAERRAVAIIEHRIRTAAEISDDMIVLDQGVTVASGETEQVRRTESVLSAYLGAPAEKVE